MKPTLLALALLAAGCLSGQDTLPPSLRKQDFKVMDMKVGDSACSVATYASVEHHVWVPARGVTRMGPHGCVWETITRLSSGWRIILSDPIKEEDSDEWYSARLYLRMTEVYSPHKEPK